MRRNLGHLEGKKQITAETKRLNVVKKSEQISNFLRLKKKYLHKERDWYWWKTNNKFRIFCGWKTNNSRKNEAECGRKIRTNLQHFGARNK